VEEQTQLGQHLLCEYWWRRNWIRAEDTGGRRQWKWGQISFKCKYHVEHCTII